MRRYLLIGIALTVSVVSGCEDDPHGSAGAGAASGEPSADWAYVLTTESREILERKSGPFSCARLEEYLRENDSWAAFYAIRDAALFDDPSCADEIKRAGSALQTSTVRAMAVYFYRLRRGDEKALGPLLEIFDKEAIELPDGPAVDHVVVSLFGYLPDWNQTGRRLLRHLRRADGAAGEVVHNALDWKRYLFSSDPGYAEGCARAAASEDMSAQAELVCRPWTSEDEGGL